MLGPFRIRNLPPRSPRRSLPAGSAISRRSSVDGGDGVVIFVLGYRYEALIQDMPAGKLKYTDADRDVITVGSSQELRERLAEPVSKLRRSQASKQKQSIGTRDVPLRPASPEMHVFEIDPMEAAIQAWHDMWDESLRIQPDDIWGWGSPSPNANGDVSGQSANVGPTLKEKYESHFKNSHPPQLHGSEESLSAAPDAPQSTSSDAALTSSAEPANVLTPKGVMQAQLAGERIRERLGNPGPRIERANAVNSWASYAQLPERQPEKHLPVYEPPGPFAPLVTQPLQEPLRPNSMMPAPPSFLPREAIAGSQHQTDMHSSEAVHGSLLPAFYENVQASLAKLSPEMATLSGEFTDVEENLKDPVTCQPEEASAKDNTGAESGEAAEITMSKMVLKSMGEMTDILARMNGQFDAQLTPKLVSERLKCKNKLLPTHRQDTVRDLFTIRRALEDFALEIAETKQTLARFESDKVFPEDTNLVDFNSMTAAAYSFGRLTRSMDDMIIAARRSMLPAQIENGESKYHTPRRLARVGYEDTWSVTIASVTPNVHRYDIQELADEARGEVGLPPLEARDILVHQGSALAVEIVIDGISHAQETWKSLLSARNRHILCPHSEWQVNLARKHYPTVYRCSRALFKAAASIPSAPPKQSDIDVARLKALQDRRAAWRKEFKARTQSVRFNDAAKIIDDAPKVEKEKHFPAPIKAPTEDTVPRGSKSFKHPASEMGSSSHHRTSYRAQPNRPAPYLRALKSTRSAPDLKENVSRRSSQQKTPDASAPLQSNAPVQGRPATYHSIRYPPGLFPPQPPVPSYPTASAGHPAPTRPQSFYLPPPPPLPWSSQNSKERLPPPSLPPLNRPTDVEKQSFPPLLHPKLNHRASEPNFSPLPSFPALQPLRLQPLAQPQNESQQRAPPGAWPVVATGENESSGAFFRRMMGRSPAPADEVSPISSPLLGATGMTDANQPPVSPLGPYPELSRSASTKTPKTVTLEAPAQGSLRRSATVTSAPTHRAPPPKSAGGPWSRRPYSQTFDGAGRQRADRVPPPVAPKPVFPRPTAAQPQAGKAPPVAPKPAMPSVSVTATQAGVQSSLLRQTAPPPEPNTTPSIPTQITWCVNQLQELGYGDMHNGGMDRLAMYAYLTDGELEATIDLIEEERQAWNEQDSSSPAPEGSGATRNQWMDI